MSPEEFRKYGYELIDWIVKYWEEVEDYPVLSQVEPGEIRAQLSKHPPKKAEKFESFLQDIDDIIIPGITHWQSPNFFGYFPANTSGPSILGELLSAGLGIQGMLWSTSPAATELETHVMDWLAEMLVLPEKFHSSSTGGGVIEDSASSAALCAIIAARERVTNYQYNLKGGNGKLVAYASAHAHSSIEKAAKIAGIGSDNLHLIEADENYAMRPEALVAQIRKDREAGLVPFFVTATVGTTSSTAIDPLPEIGKICESEGLWMHVDAALAGSAAIIPEYRYINDGVEYADSYCFNPHKWMFTNFDCDAFFVADRKALIKALSILPEYLRNKATESGAVIDYRDWQIPLGRRFRALKLWFVIRYYGVEGLRYHLRKHIEMAQAFANWVDSHPDYELLAPVPLNTVCFHYKGSNEFNQILLEKLNQSGKLFMTHTTLDGNYTLRFVVGQTYVEPRHVKAAWELIQETTALLKAEND